LRAAIERARFAEEVETMRSTVLLAAAGAGLALAAGCGPTYCDPNVDYSCAYGPVDYVGIGIDPYGSCLDPISCGCLDPTVCLTRAEPAPSACAAGDGSCLVRSLATASNGALRDVVEPVDALLGEEGSRQGDRVVYGPLDASAPGSGGGATARFRLTVRRSTGMTAWKLEAEPLGGSQAWSTVFTGSMAPGPQPRRGRGVLGVNLDALAAVNPAAYPDGGEILGAFRNDARQKATRYRLRAFRTADARAADGEISSSTAADGTVRTVLASPGQLPVEIDASATPLAGGAPATSSATAPDPGAPPGAMPDPGF
jgi:hypothetical protein